MNTGDAGAINGGEAFNDSCTCVLVIISVVDAALWFSSYENEYDSYSWWH